MGLSKSFKKITKSIGGGLQDIGGIVFGRPAKGGPQNPYGPADFSRLYNFSDLDFLKKPVAARPDTGALFKDYLGAIDAPSSTDEVTKRIEGDLMKSLIGGVDEDVAGVAGSLKSDFLDRGLSGPGMISDIEANELGRTYTAGAKAKGDIRSQFSLAQLEREKAKELARQEAYKSRYGIGEDLNKTLLGFEQEDRGQLADLITQRIISAITGQAGAQSDATKNEIAGRTPRERGALEEIIRNIKLGINLGR